MASSIQAFTMSSSQRQLLLRPNTASAGNVQRPSGPPPIEGTLWKDIAIFTTDVDPTLFIHGKVFSGVCFGTLYSQLCHGIQCQVLGSEITRMARVQKTGCPALPVAQRHTLQAGHSHLRIEVNPACFSRRKSYPVGIRA